VQQGMSSNGFARRYHWLSGVFQSFVEEPHSAVCCDSPSHSLNLTAKECAETRKCSVDLARERPERLKRLLEGQAFLQDFTNELKRLELPKRHLVERVDLNASDLKVLRRAYELKPSSYEELLCLKGMGGRS